MWIFLPLLSALCALKVHCFFDGTCPRKDPPPGALVLSPGSKLVLACSGQVRVNGVEVTITRESTNTHREGDSLGVTPVSVRGQDAVGHNGGVLVKRDIHSLEDALSEGDHTRPTEAGVSTVTGENGETVVKSEYKALYTDRYRHTAPTTAPTLQPTRASRQVEAEYDWHAEETDSEDDYEEEEGGSRVTRGLRMRPQWRWKGRTLRPGESDSGEVVFERRGIVLSLPAVRLENSGKYSCHRMGKMVFSVKVIVADPPEHPTVSCYKKSPSSKIRCQWTPQQPVLLQPSCYLFLSKGFSERFSRTECSYSSQLSRCWCALDYNEDEQRVLHMAYLCVTSAAGNATSNLVNFTPMDILKPDPPSAVEVHQEEGQERRLTVTWNFPSTWKSHNRFYVLNYEISYQPNKPLAKHGTQRVCTTEEFHTITDVLPGVEYLIQVRAKNEYDGLWSEWSSPVYAHSWTAVLQYDDLSTMMYPFYRDDGGSGDDIEINKSESHTGVETEWRPVLWISGACVLLLVALTACVFRHKNKFVSKLLNLSVITQCSDCSQPPAAAPTPREGQALVTFGPPRYKEPSPNEVEEEDEEKEEEGVEERKEAMHFNNTSYFLVQRDC